MPCLAAVRRVHLVPFLFEHFAQGGQQHRIVVDEQDPRGPRDALALRTAGRRLRRRRDLREKDAERGALARRAHDLDVRAMALRDAVDHRETEAGTAFALGREERLETAAARRIVHADAGVRDLDEHARALLAGDVTGTQHEPPAVRASHRSR